MLCLMRRTDNKNCMWRTITTLNTRHWSKNYGTSFRCAFLSFFTHIRIFHCISTFFPYIFVFELFSRLFHVIWMLYSNHFLTLTLVSLLFPLLYWLFRIPRHFLVFYHNFILNPFFVYHLISTFSLFSAFKSCISCLLSQFHIISLNLYVSSLAFPHVY